MRGCREEEAATWVMVSTTLALITMLTLRGPVPIFSKYFS